MPFVQITEYKTGKIDWLNAGLDGWLEATKGKRAATRGVQTRDRDATNTYVQIVEFPSYEDAMANSNLLHVTMDAPSLEWTLTARSTRVLDTLNAMSVRTPLSTWRPTALVHARERLAGRWAWDRLQMSGIIPTGHTGTLMPQRTYYIYDAHAVLDGIHLRISIVTRTKPGTCSTEKSCSPSATMSSPPGRERSCSGPATWCTRYASPRPSPEYSQS